MHKTTLQIVEVYYNFKDKVIKWPIKDKKKRKSIENTIQKEFLGCIEKINGTNIGLKNKLRSIYNEKKFSTQKKYALDFYTIFDSSIRFIYILVSWPNF